MKATKKPIEIDYYPVEEKYFKKIMEWSTEERPIRILSSDLLTEIYITTLEGEMKAHHNDIIIKGIDGEVYPCKKDIFKKTYEFQRMAKY